jgi:outer membrane usher protein
VILSVTANGVPHGEFTLRRTSDGDYWVSAGDLPRLGVAPQEQARRTVGSESYYSLRALGAAAIEYNEAELSLSLRFPAEGLEGARIDLSNRPPPTHVEQARTSLILSYRLSARRALGQTDLLGDSDVNVRWQGLLLRQETHLDTSGTVRRIARGRSQAIYDDVPNARRFIAGDVLSSAGAYGSAITGAGLQLLKLYDLTPDIITQPTASFQTSATLPSQVEVAVDGNVVSRTSVGPGPITINNLLDNGGARTVRVTVTDASGRREVIERPFLFTDSVLARGLHDYGYFVGRRSELAADNHWHYAEAAWQGFHRYGLTDSLTVSGGGEGSPEFTNAGAGLTLRSDRLGLLSVDLLGSHDRQRGTTARGWSGRYTWQSPFGSFIAGRRQFDDGFRTFTTSPTLPFLRRETRLAASTQLWNATAAAELVRSEDALGTQDTRLLRLSSQFTRDLSFTAEYQNTRVNGTRGWAVNLFVRLQLDGPNWVGAVAHAAPGVQTLDLEAGRQIEQGEGFGYRAGTSITRAQGVETALASLSANWNLRSAGLEFFTTQPVRGAAAQFSELGVSGAVVGVDGSFGVTRQVNDSFVLARVGVPLPGIDVYLNNQLQGKTDAEGKLFIPEVGAFGRQDVSLEDKQVPMQYSLKLRRRTITPAFRSGTVVDFGGTRQRAVAGMAWQQRADGQRSPIASRAWTMNGPGGALAIETGQAGDFYLENASPGRYAGALELGGRVQTCRMDIPDFAEAVYELKEGIVCE